MMQCAVKLGLNAVYGAELPPRKLGQLLHMPGELLASALELA